MGVLSSQFSVLSSPSGSFNTKNRPEITLEGSRDGQEWKEYRFKFKPGPLNRRPPWGLGHMPRLDWQMWFAALRPPGRYPYWFQRFMDRLLAGSPEVLALLEENPFSDLPPKMIRARVANYYFSEPEVKSETGEWWVKGADRVYAPAKNKNKPAKLYPY